MGLFYKTHISEGHTLIGILKLFVLVGVVRYLRIVESAIG